MASPRPEGEDTMEDRLKDFIQAQFDYQRENIKAKSKKAYTFQYKGNQLQAEFNESLLDKLAEVKELVKCESQNRSNRLLDEIVKDIKKHIKVFKFERLSLNCFVKTVRNIPSI